MLIFPAIDLYGGRAVRLYKGDYAQMTVYSEHPEKVADDFVARGARCMHLVDLEGAKTGLTPNLEIIRSLRSGRELFTEVGGGIRSMATIEAYLGAGIDRVILGTAAVTQPDFLNRAVRAFGERVAVGVDIRDGFVAIKGWTEQSALEATDFCRQLEDIGVRTIIVTDISRDGAMKGTNHDLYAHLSRETGLNIVASGGVSDLDDVRRLRERGLYAAIIGKAYYTGAIDLREAIEAAQ